MQVKSLENVVMFSLSTTRLWTSNKKLQEKVDVKTDLPQDLGSLGHKKTISPDALAPLNTVKKRMETILRNVGIRFLGGFAVPASKAEEVSQELDLAVRDGYIAKETLLSNYESEVESWIAKHPEWEGRIRASVTPKGVVDASIRFGYEAFSMAPVAGLNSQLQDQVSKMGSTLLNEVAEEMGELYERSVLGKLQVNRRIIQPLLRLRGKLFGLSFLDPVVQPLLQLIDQTLAAMPSNAPISGKELAILVGCLLVMSDEQRMRKHAAKVISGVQDDDQDDVPVATPPVQVSLLPDDAVPAVPAVPAVASVPQSVVSVAAPAVASAPVVAPVAAPVTAPVPQVAVADVVAPSVTATPAVTQVVAPTVVHAPQVAVPAAVVPPVAPAPVVAPAAPTVSATPVKLPRLRAVA